MLFGVPDEITYMTRSLEMVETYSYIGRLHSDTEMVRVVSNKFRSTKGYRNPPREVIGPHGPNGGREEAGQGVARAPLAQTVLD